MNNTEYLMAEAKWRVRSAFRCLNKARARRCSDSICRSRRDLARANKILAGARRGLPAYLID